MGAMQQTYFCATTFSPTVLRCVTRLSRYFGSEQCYSARSYSGLLKADPRAQMARSRGPLLLQRRQLHQPDTWTLGVSLKCLHDRGLKLVGSLACSGVNGAGWLGSTTSVRSGRFHSAGFAACIVLLPSHRRALNSTTGRRGPHAFSHLK